MDFNIIITSEEIDTALERAAKSKMKGIESELESIITARIKNKFTYIALEKMARLKIDELIAEGVEFRLGEALKILNDIAGPISARMDSLEQDVIDAVKVLVKQKD